VEKMSMKNPREVAIKILENAKKALKEKMESLEKAEGKNTAQLNEFKGIPQPPAPKAPEKAIAPTPKIPQPKMPSLGKPSKPLTSFMKSRMEKANSHQKGIHPSVNSILDKPHPKLEGKSIAGLSGKENEMREHQKVLAEIKSMPKPALGKAEEMNKAKIYDIKSKKMIADHGEPEKTTPPKGNLKLVGSAPAKQQPKAPVKKQPKSAK
jgi:hypothetical protein